MYLSSALLISLVQLERQALLLPKALPLFSAGRSDRSDSQDHAEALGALDQNPVVPLDRAEPGLAVGIELGGHGLTGHLGEDGELHRLAIGLEADRGPGVVAENEHREDVVVVTPAVVVAW